jgi:hypothetical protein
MRGSRETDDRPGHSPTGDNGRLRGGSHGCRHVNALQPGARSATVRLNDRFSRSNSFRVFTSSALLRPYPGCSPVIRISDTSSSLAKSSAPGPRLDPVGPPAVHHDPLRRVGSFHHVDPPLTRPAGPVRLPQTPDRTQGRITGRARPRDQLQARRQGRAPRSTDRPTANRSPTTA